MNYQETLTFIKNNMNDVQVACFKLGGVVKEPNIYIFKSKLSKLIPKLKSSSASSIFDSLEHLNELEVIRPRYTSDYTNQIYVFFPSQHNIFTISKVFGKDAYFSHHAAIYLNQLTKDRSNTIYLKNTFKNKTNLIERSDFKQKSVDVAFSKPMRKSNKINYIWWNDTDYKIVIIEGVSLNKKGIKMLAYGNNKDLFIPYSDIERTLIDAVIRPTYSGGMDSIVEAFFAAKEIIDIRKMALYLNELNLNYPYERNVALYMKKAGYNQLEINFFLNNINLTKVTYDFYLDYQIIKKVYDSELQIYYPLNLLDKTV